MTNNEPAYKSVDIESMRALNELGQYIGRPNNGITYPKLEIYAPDRRHIATLFDAHVKAASIGASYTRDVYTCSQTKTLCLV